MAERIIEQANLNAIERNLGAIHGELETITSGVGTVNDNVKTVYTEIGSLAQEFHEFVFEQKRANRKSEAQTKLIQIRQELEKKYGHYDIVRRTTTGILQADDLGIVRKDTISTATEELMISTPGYWLAPCLVALAAWISDQPELAETALKEGLRRNDEKTSLFFALICRRADRKDASLKWVQRYLENQDEENLDRKTVIVLDAFASGLFGADTEGVVSRQINSWLDNLESQSGFIEQQVEQWSDAINLKRVPIDTSSYTYLKKYSKTWLILEDIMEGAYLHAEMFEYLKNVFEQQVSTASVKEELDRILNSLVSDYDDEELPLRKEEKFEQLVVDCDGDENRARSNMVIEQTVFETTKDFTQLLTDAAMNPEDSHSSVSTQKFAFALSRDWVMEAYRDIIAQNRQKIPNEIEINLDDFKSKTTDGNNEYEIVESYRHYVSAERERALSQCVLSGFEEFCLYGGATIGVVGLVMAVLGNVFLGIIAAIAGVGLVINHFSKKNQLEQNIQNIKKQFEKRRYDGTQIIRAALAEVVDFRIEFSEKDSESQNVIDLLEAISPDQYVKKISTSNRRIKV